MRKLRSIAFQRCITLYSQKWTVWPWEAIFYQKMLHKQLFREALNPDSLTSEQSGTPNFKNLTSFNMFPENLGAKAFRWAIGKPAGIKIVRSAAAWNISWGGPQEMQKSEFFASFASPRKFCEEKFYQDRTMWDSQWANYFVSYGHICTLFWLAQPKIKISTTFNCHCCIRYIQTVLWSHNWIIMPIGLREINR